MLIYVYGRVLRAQHANAPTRIGLNASGAVDSVIQRPVLAVGVAAGAALIIARKPIFSLLAGLFTDNDRKAGPRNKELPHGKAAQD